MDKFIIYLILVVIAAWAGRISETVAWVAIIVGAIIHNQNIQQEKLDEISEKLGSYNINE